MGQVIRCDSCGAEVHMNYMTGQGVTGLFDWVCDLEGKWTCPVCQKLDEEPSSSG